MVHDHGHDHTHGANKKVLLISFFIITIYMIVEAIGGYLTNSLALLADAGHMLSDAISLAIALIAFKLAEKVANNSKTFGYKRFEILAAVINGLTLIGIALLIFYEAIDRFANPPEVASTGMLVIATIGLAINVLVAWIMMRGADVEENLNMRGAYLHVISDMLGSVGAIVAALLIMFFGWGWTDPLASVIVAILVLRSGYHVTKAAIHVLMEGTPQNVDVNDVIQSIEKVKGVQSIHDLHIWTITSGLNALSCHVIVNDNLTVEKSQIILRTIEHELEDKRIGHVTIQVETEKHPHKNVLFCQTDYVMAGHHHGHSH